jgi:Na+/H+-dicarboxylate symporter
MKHTLSLAVVAALFLGVGTGLLLHAGVSPEARAAWVAGFSVITDLFLRLIRMIVAPLVLATLIGGIAHIDDPAKLGRIGARTILWFLAASIVSLLLGFAIVSLLRPGVGASLGTLAPADAAIAAPPPFSIATFLTHLVPTSIVSALADNEILQIVLFSLVAGISLIAIGPARARPLVAGLDALAALMLQMTAYIMRVSPAAVFAALASAVTKQGIDILFVYGRFLGDFYIGLALLWVLLFAAGFLFCGRRVFADFRYRLHEARRCSALHTKRAHRCTDRAIAANSGRGRCPRSHLRRRPRSMGGGFPRISVSEPQI